MNGPQVGVIPGNHLVAVANGAVVVVPHREPSTLNSESKAAQTWSALYALIAEAKAAEGDRFGHSFARNAAKWAADRDGDAEFGALSPVQGGYALILHGGVAAIVEHEGGRDQFRGSRHCPTQDEIRSDAYRAALYVTDDSLPTIDLPAERGVGSLIEGVVEGTGAVLWLTGTKPAARTPKPAAHHVELKPPKVFETLKPDDKPPPRRAPLPVKGKSRSGAAGPGRPRIGAGGRHVRGNQMRAWTFQ